MPPYIDVYLTPIRDNPVAQKAIIALLLLTAADVVYGIFNAMYWQHDFSSHELRKGLIKKLGNFGLLLVADVIDALLIGGLDIGFQPVLVALAVFFILMEIASILELYEEAHPEVSQTRLFEVFRNAKGKDVIPVTGYKVADAGVRDEQ